MKIMVAAGGTAGHLFPALSLIQNLKNLDKTNRFFLVLNSYSYKKNLLIPGYVDLLFIDSRSVSRSLSLHNLISVVKLFKGFVQSFIMVIKHKPDIVVGFGGYASFAICLFSVMNKIPTLIHEQNVVCGKANLLLSRIVDKVLVSFPETLEYFKKRKINAILVGNPTRPDLKRIESVSAKKQFGFEADKFVILVAGGSQGSRRINQVFPEALKLIPKEIKSRFSVIHLSGKSDFDSICAAYNNLGIDYKVYDFFEDMSSAYSASDLVISRSGAMTVTEICFFGKASILIPYPFAYGHQVQNAEYLSVKGASVLVEEKFLNASLLKDKILDIYKDENVLSRMRKIAENSFPLDAGSKLAQELDCIYKKTLR